MRICSLLPSATEIVFSLGLGNQLIAVTHECDFPSETSLLPAITKSSLDHQDKTSREINTHISQAVHNGSSIYELNQSMLESLNPDIILTQELCHVCAVSYSDVETATRSLPGSQNILSLEPTSLTGILDTISAVGNITGAVNQSKDLVANLAHRIELIASRVAASSHRPTVLALEWLDPPFIGGHWIPEMVRLAGGLDKLGTEQQPSVETSWSAINRYNPDVIILMPCGYGIDSTITDFSAMPIHEEWKNLNAVRSNNVYAVDGSSYFNRPGPRIVDGLAILAEILHPDIFPRESPLDAWRRVAPL